MERQRQMEDAFLKAHREFISSLDNSLEILQKDILEVEHMEQKCTNEWCEATETYLDDIAKMIFSISEPRWLTKEDSKRIRVLREGVHDLYSHYKQVKA